MLAEEYRVGGTCVIRGCVPKKLLVYASRFADDFHDAEGFGWSLGETRFDWATLIRNKDKEIDRLEREVHLRLMGRPDAREGALAFLEKRDPNWELTVTDDYPDDLFG